MQTVLIYLCFYSYCSLVQAQITPLVWLFVTNRIHVAAFCVEFNFYSFDSTSASAISLSPKFLYVGSRVSIQGHIFSSVKFVFMNPNICETTMKLAGWKWGTASFSHRGFLQASPLLPFCLFCKFESVCVAGGKQKTIQSLFAPMFNLYVKFKGQQKAHTSTATGNMVDDLVIYIGVFIRCIRCSLEGFVSNVAILH